MIDVDFVSSNPGKVREVRTLLAPYGVRVRWVKRTLAEPQAADLEEVALHKLSASRRRAGYWLVEDSGLFIPSLGGFPGVYSAHMLKIWGFGPILELLRRRDRSASYLTVAALGRGRSRWTFRGELRGSIAPRPRGRNGFGYDPIFVPEGHRETLGELPSATKDAISHRAGAMHQVGAFLATQAQRAGSPARRSVRKGRKGLI